MREKIDCFLAYDHTGNMHERVLQLRDSKTIQHIYLLVPEALQQTVEVPQGCQLLPVQGIAAKDCVLFLWVTMPCLEEGLELIRKWGFTYKTCGFNWVKRNKKADSFFLGLGYWTRSNSEICLLGTRGHPSRVSHSTSQVCDARIMEHSKKPEEIRERIVELCGNLPRIELFARERCEGWVSLGNEIDGKDIREAILEV